MAVHFHVRTSDSMPERKHVTQEIELRKRQQAEAEQKTKAEQSQKDKAA
jgi:hypothetical protein